MRLWLGVFFAGVLLAQNGTGVIEGQVTDAMTKAPVRKATVTLQWIGGAPAPPGAAGAGQSAMLFSGRIVNPVGSGSPGGMRNGPSTVKTDEGGSFAFRDLAPGAYIINAQHPGYPARIDPFSGKPVRVDGTNAARYNIELTPAAKLSGRVVDEDNEPITGCMVQLTGPQGRQTNGPVGNRPTDENGEFRMWGIVPDKYIVSALCPRPPFEPRPLSAGPPPPSARMYPRQYYPLAQDLQSAQTIELMAGSELSGIDFQLKPAPVYTVSGAISGNGVDPRAMGNINIQLVPHNGTQGLMGMYRGAMVNKATGSYEIRQVFPGSYTLLAMESGNGRSSQGAFRRALEVGSGPVRLDVVLQPTVTLTGSIEVEGDAAAVTSQPMLQLIPTEPTSPPVQGKVAADRSFTLPSVLPVSYKVMITAPGVFVKSIDVGGQQLKDRVLDVSNGASGPVRILLSTKVAKLQGTGQAGDVWAIQSISEDSGFAFATRLEVDGGGSIRLGGLAPGKYRLTKRGKSGPGGTTAVDIELREGEEQTLNLPGAP